MERTEARVAKDVPLGKIAAFGFAEGHWNYSLVILCSVFTIAG